MENIVILNPTNLEQVKQRIKEQGAENLIIIADFGRTFTKAFVNGEKEPTSFAQIREKDYLEQEYQDKANELFRKYHPTEINPDLSSDEKNPILTEWWEKHLKLMVEYGINKEIII